MAIHKPGPRLGSSIPFKFLGGAKGSGGRKKTDVSLNVVPFVDMMTILTTFLLMSFSIGYVLLAKTQRSPRNQSRGPTATPLDNDALKALRHSED